MSVNDRERTRGEKPADYRRISSNCHQLAGIDNCLGQQRGSRADERTMYGGGDATYVHQESNGRVTQNPKHGCRVGVEQGHSVGEFVADDQVLLGVVLVRQRRSRQRSSIITEVVLNRRRFHLVLVKLQHELQYLGQLFDQSLLRF